MKLGCILPSYVLPVGRFPVHSFNQSILNSDGVTPIAFLKQRLKYLGSEKPQR